MEQENKIENGPTKKRKFCPSLILLVSLIGIAILIVFLIFLALYDRPGCPAKSIICVNHLKGIAVGVILYWHDNGDKFPASDKWNDLILEYVEDNEPYICPLVNRKSKICTYVLNRNIYDLEDPIPADMVLAFEGPPGWNQAGGP